MEKLSLSSIMVTLSLLGEIPMYTERSGTIIASILMGEMDDDIRILHFHQEKQRLPESVEEAREWPEGDVYLNKMKDWLRSRMQAAIDGEAERLKRKAENERNANLAKAKTSFKEMNKPAPEGTIKELAAKYGKSIGEIRRMKNEEIGRAHV